MAAVKDRGAVMQFEFDRNRIQGAPRKINWGTNTLSTYEAAIEIVRGALADVLTNDGTLVVVVSPKKITVVQRPDTADLEA